MELVQQHPETGFYRGADSSNDKFAEVVNRIFEHIPFTQRWVYPKNLEDLLRAQSIAGSANNGHGLFNRMRFPSKTVIDVMLARGIDLDEGLKLRQRECDKICGLVNSLMKRPTVKPRTTYHGEPVAGIDEVIDDPLAFLAGFAFAVAADSLPIRRLTQEKYKHKIGGGEFYAANMVLMRERNLTPSYFNSREFDDELLSRRINEGLLFTGKKQTSIDWQDIYVRRELGSGVSDDKFVILSGIRWGKSGYLGAVTGDALDTWSKCKVFCGDEDTETVLMKDIFRWANEKGYLLGFKGYWMMYEEDVPVPAELIDLVHTVRKSPRAPVHSSHRYFFKEQHPDTCAFEEYLRFVDLLTTTNSIQGAKKGIKKMSEIPLGFDRVSSGDFYRHFLDDLLYLQRKYGVNTGLNFN